MATTTLVRLAKDEHKSETCANSNYVNKRGNHSRRWKSNPRTSGFEKIALEDELQYPIPEVVQFEPSGPQPGLDSVVEDPIPVVVQPETMKTVVKVVEGRDKWGCHLSKRYTRINQEMDKNRTPRTKLEILTAAGLTKADEGGHFTWLVRKGFARKIGGELYTMDLL